MYLPEIDIDQRLSRNPFYFFITYGICKERKYCFFCDSKDVKVIYRKARLCSLIQETISWHAKSSRRSGLRFTSVFSSSRITFSRRNLGGLHFINPVRKGLSKKRISKARNLNLSISNIAQACWLSDMNIESTAAYITMVMIVTMNPWMYIT